MKNGASSGQSSADFVFVVGPAVENMVEVYDAVSIASNITGFDC